MNLIGCSDVRDDLKDGQLIRCLTPPPTVAGHLLVFLRFLKPGNISLHHVEKVAYVKTLTLIGTG